MKPQQLREKLNKKYHEKFKKNNLNFKGDKEDNLKIIGITGSRGKTGIVYMLHKYLADIGYKVVSYSSQSIKSPLAFYKENEAVEVAINNEENLLNAVAEALDYEADYLILEINESTLSKNIIDELSFDMRVLTNIVPKQNDIIYEDYVNIKKSFLRNASKKEQLVIGIMDDDTTSLYNELKGYNFVTYSTEYLASRYLGKTNKIDYLLTPSNLPFESISGLNFNIKHKNNLKTINSKLLFSYNAINILCLYTIVNALNVYDDKLFTNLVYDITIPGREDIIKTNNRLIMISVSLIPHLEYLKKMKERGEINNIIVVTGAAGAGYVNWHKEVSQDKYMKDKMQAMQFAYNYISQNVDSLYITMSDNGTLDEDEWLKTQADLVSDNISYVIEKNRKTAIEKALLESENNDVIFISGRGNRRIMCDGPNHISYFDDKEEVCDLLKNIKFK